MSTYTLMPEFDRHVLEVLREPIESGRIVISRATRSASFPAQFQLVAAMNPCPCGYAGDPSGRCRCTPDQIARYRGRVSGPLLDRIDLCVEVPRLPLEKLTGEGGGESSEVVRARVLAARRQALLRTGQPNAEISSAQLQRDCALGRDERRWLQRALERLSLSARAYHRVLRVARTIADLDQGAAVVAREHLAEALQMRRLLV